MGIALTRRCRMKGRKSAISNIEGKNTALEYSRTSIRSDGSARVQPYVSFGSPRGWTLGHRLA